MRTLRALLTSGLLCALTASCASTPVPYTVAAPVEDVAAEIVEFTPGDWATRTVTAISDGPIELDHFAGWWGRAHRRDGATVAPRPDRAYVAVAASTRCRQPTGVRVTRSGDDLRVEFTGGDELPECVRSFGPSVVVSVPAADVTGVRTVDGQVPVSAEGPGTATGFHRLPGAPAGVRAAELGPGAAELAGALAGAGPDVAAALAAAPAPGQRGFAFVVLGCEETGAVLLVASDEISAEPTGGENVTCYVPEYYLATFTIAGDAVPPGATLPS